MFAGDGVKDAGLCLFSGLLSPEFALSASACALWTTIQCLQEVDKDLERYFPNNG